MNTKLLKQKILDLAIRGKLTQQLKSDGTAADLLKEICDRTQEKTSLRAKRGNPSPQTIIPLDKSEAPFEIPANWEWVQLKNICDKLVDGDHNPPKGFPEKTEYLMLSSRNINENSIVDLENVRYLTKDTFEEENKRTRLQKGDILFTSVGSLGRSCVYSGNGNYCFQRSVSVIHTKIFNKYLKYFFDSSYYQKLIVENATGTAQLGFYLEQMSKSTIAIPPLTEQQRIVAKIEEAFAEIDAIEKNKELLKTHIKQTRQKILDLAIHGKLVPQNKSDEPASVLLERITRDTPHYEKLTDIPFEIPDSWEWVKLGDVVEINPKNKLDDNLEVSFIPMNLIEAGYSNRHKQESKFWKDVKKGFTHFAENDVALAKISPCFENRKSAIMKNLKNGYGAGTTELFVFRSSNVMLPSYLLWIIKSDDFIQAGTGNFSGVVGQQRLSREIVENYHIALPPLAEQKRIVDKIEEIFASLDEISLHLV